MSDALKIKTLIDYIEAGDCGPLLPYSDHPARVSFVWESSLCLEAFLGSLEDAKKLHDKVLPGWGWYVGDGLGQEGPYACVQNDEHNHDSEGDNPARAWLIAILKAKLQEDRG